MDHVEIECSSSLSALIGSLKLKTSVKNCFKYIAFSPVNTERFLHPVPKDRILFETVYINHCGLIDKRVALIQYIFLIVDAFSKFVRLYATKTTNAHEAIGCLTQYFQSFSIPKVIVSDRDTAFVSNEFKDYTKQQCMKHVKKWSLDLD
ncbi:Pro-Pol polyprotein [Trachymyrmex septentrionalis]|uniref:Pro-Pol polyprotein n=1 Tax=Trachymyrmex septentrionalis TaxID=34720 RepID=A0A151JUG0_9HYME|nr:Pro-Pol polyprotein [Trachymyrmex septentrionalis]